MAKQEEKSSKKGSAPKVSADPKTQKTFEKFLQAQEEATRRSESLQDLSKKIGENWKDLGRAVELAVKHQSTLGDMTEDYQDLVQDVYQNIEDIGSASFKQIDVQKRINKLTAEQKDVTEDIESKKQTIISLDSKLRPLLEQKAKAEKLYLKFTQEGNEAAAERAKQYLDSKQDQADSLSSLINKNKVELSSLETTKDQIDAASQILEPLAKAQEVLQKSNDRAKEMGISLEDIKNDLAAPFENALSIVNKIPGGGLIRNFLGLDGKLKAVTNQVMSSFTQGLVEGKGVGEAAFTALSSGASTFLATLGPIILAAGAIYATIKLFKKALELDQESAELARNLGITKDEAHEINDNLESIARHSKILGATSKDYKTAFADLTKATGLTAINSKEALDAQVLLTKQYGMTGEEAAQAQMTASAMGVDTTQMLGTVKSMTDEYNKLTGDSLNFKEVSKDIAKVSKTTLAAYHGDVKALGKAVIQAKRLGMTMEDTKAIADNLLDIESSLENEMKANVLTGKSMNMNAARELALKGDSAGAAAEALKQAGDYNEFLNMSVVQQKAVADAAGMTVEQITNAANIQKINSKLTGKQIKNLSELTKEERDRLVASGDISEEAAKKIALDEQQASTQEKIAGIVDKISVAFDNMGKIFSPIVEMVGWFADHWDLISSIIAGVATTLAVVMLPSIVSMLPALAEMAISAGAMAIEMAANAIAAITTFVASTGGLGALALAGGIAVGVAAYNSATDEATKDVHDGEIAPDGGLVVSGKKGKYQLAPDDTVIAGTGLSSANAMTPSTAAPAVMNSNQELVNILKQILTAVNQPAQIVIGNKAIAELDTQINLKRSYNTKIDKAYGTFG